MRNEDFHRLPSPGPRRCPACQTPRLTDVPCAVCAERRLCSYCGGPVPENRHKFCSDLCQVRLAGDRRNARLSYRRQSARAVPRLCLDCPHPVTAGERGAVPKRCAGCTTKRRNRSQSARKRLNAPKETP